MQAVHVPSAVLPRGAAQQPTRPAWLAGVTVLQTVLLAFLLIQLVRISLDKSHPDGPSVLSHREYEHGLGREEQLAGSHGSRREQLGGRHQDPEKHGRELGGGGRRRQGGEDQAEWQGGRDYSRGLIWRHARGDAKRSSWAEAGGSGAADPALLRGDGAAAVASGDGPAGAGDESAGDGDGRGDGESSGGSSGTMRIKREVVYQEQTSTWPYSCWTPKAGLSEPSLTMVTVIDGLPKQYRLALWQNRLQYAARHSYRYCELQVTDRNKIPAFAKLPWILALAPCSDFLVHLDADAMLVHLELPLDPWVQFMQAKDIDQMFSTDAIPESPINFGVFMVDPGVVPHLNHVLPYRTLQIRPAPWLWSFYRKVYNMCVCDWARSHDWPAEQGIAYDLLAGNLESYETIRSMIVPTRGWNHIIFDNRTLPGEDDVLVHLTNPTRYPVNHSCWQRQGFNKKCKFVGLQYFLDEVIGTKQNQLPDVASLFVEEKNGCQQVRHNSLFAAHTTYSNRPDSLSASVMDFDIDPVNGFVTGVKVSEVGCVGYRDFGQCKLPKLWDVNRGEGPWPVSQQDIV